MRLRLFQVFNLLFTGILLWIAPVSAEIIRGDTGAAVSLEEALSAVKAGDIILFGEQHNLLSQKERQLQVLNFLRAKGLRVSTGLEFLSYLNQGDTDEFRAGNLTEGEYLKQLEWSSNNEFAAYREQILFPQNGSKCLALNAPSWFTRKISQGGLKSLTPHELIYLPPGFSLGRASYKERFIAAMQSHIPDPAKLDDYFAAQSVWDDSMAWIANDFISKNPSEVLVITVGEFHVQYGGGLKDRILAKGQRQVWTMSSLEASFYQPGELEKELLVSPKYGPRADFIWY